MSSGPSPEARDAGGEVALVAELGMALQRHRATLGLAESCTGGLAGALCTGQAGASRWFQGSVVAYADTVKEEMLGVRRATIEEWGAVSEACAAEMAEGARRALNATVAVSITGVAGPDGGTPGKPVGTVCFGVASSGPARTGTVRFPGDRDAVRRGAARHALELARRAAEEI